MKIKVQVLSTLQPQQKTSQAGKPYTIWQWICNVKNEQNAVMQNVLVKTMNKSVADTISTQWHEAELQTYNNEQSLFIKGNQQSGGGGYQKKEYKKFPFSSFEVLVRKCWELSCSINPDNPAIVFDKMLGVGSMVVNIEDFNVSPVINQKVDQAINQINNVFNSNENFNQPQAMSNPWGDNNVPPSSDEGIPF